MAKSQARQLRIRLHLQLLIDAPAVGADRFRAQGKVVGDLHSPLAIDAQHGDLHLAGRQPLERGRSSTLLARQHVLAGNARGRIWRTATDRAYCFDHLLGGATLDEVAGCADFVETRREGIVVKHCERNNLGVRKQADHTPGRFNTAYPRHLDVH